MVLRRAGAAGLAGASFAGRGAGRGRGSTDGCAGAGPELAGQLRASPAARGERFLCWESPAEVFGGLDAPRALTPGRARRPARGRRVLGRVGGGSGGGKSRS